MKSTIIGLYAFLTLPVWNVHLPECIKSEIQKGFSFGRFFNPVTD